MSHSDLALRLWNKFFEHRDEILLYCAGHQSAIFVHIEYLNLFFRALISAFDMHNSLLEGPGLIGPAKQAMHGEVGEVDQVDGLAVSCY